MSLSHCVSALAGAALTLLAAAFAPSALAGDYPDSAATTDAYALWALQPRAVSVRRDGQQFEVDATMHVPVPRETVWAVLVDFPAMARIVPNLKSSNVEPGADAEHFTVRQTGTAKFGPFSKEFSSTRSVELVPMSRILAHHIAGNVKSMDSEMTLTSEAGGGTRLRYHARVDPGFWMPPVVGPSSVQKQTAEQFSALIDEMKRRAGSAAGVSQAAQR